MIPFVRSEGIRLRPGTVWPSFEADFAWSARNVVAGDLSPRITCHRFLAFPIEFIHIFEFFYVYRLLSFIVVDITQLDVIL